MTENLSSSIVYLFLGTKLRANIASAAMLLAASDAASVTSSSWLAAESTIALDGPSMEKIEFLLRYVDGEDYKQLKHKLQYEEHVGPIQKIDV